MTLLTKEEIVGVGTVAANLEDLNHVEELSVYVSHYCHRRQDVHDIALLHQQLFRFGAYRFDDRVGEQFFAVETGDALIEVDAGWTIVSVCAVRLCAVPQFIPGRPGIST